MSGVEVLGIISAVISIVDATFKVYNAAKDETGLPPNFKTVATKLPLLSMLLEDAERHVDEKADDALTSTFTPVLTDCKEKAAQLQQLFEKVILTDVDSRSERYFKAAWTFGRVETLMKGILDSVQLLTAEFPKALSQRRQENLTKAIEELSELEAEQDCRYDLFVTDPLEDKKALERKKGDRVAGTCEWILGTEDLIAWLGPSQAQRSASRANQVLWLHGNPGTGKSTLAMYLTDALSTRFSATDGHTLAYFFCDSAFDTRRTATSVIRGLLFQLIQQYPQLLSYVLPKYKERKAKLFESFDALWAIFISAAADRNTGRKYCIIDALDELDDESQKTLLRQLRETFHGADDPPDARFLVTSRPHPEIHNHLEVFPHKDLASFADVKHDVDKCIKERVAQLKYPEKVKGQVIEILRGKAEGTFLWVGIACNELENTPSKDAISRLAEMPIGLYSLYERLFSAALEKGRNKSIIRLVLNFVVVSQRPLTLWELCEACQLRPEEDDRETRIQFMREYVESCRLMVVFQDEKVLLLHQSVKDYLTRSGELRLEDSATNLDDQSDVSDISYVSSVYTQATDSTSHTLFSIEDQDPLQMASETLACHLYMDSGIHDLYLHAFQEFGSTRFSRNHDKLLEIFLKDLFRTTTEPKLELAVRLLGKRQSRSLVTASILRMLYHELNDSAESRKSMQQFLDQQEDRNYSLNRLLRSQQNASFVADTDNNKTLANELEASDDDDDETDDEEEGQNSEAGAFNHVERLINHITTGTPYQTFASNLECLTHPPTTLDAALALRNIRALRRLLRKQFNNVAQGRYAWLHDLEELGHTRDEIADILLEEVSDSPWIYFTPPPKLEPMISVQAETHLPGCVHRLAWNSFDTTGDAQTCTFVPALRESSSLLEVERLCGLAGITPSSRNVEEWNGSVAFEEDNTIAMITYAHSDVSKIIHRLEATLGLFCAAIRYCQSQQLCCDSFTVLKQPASILYEKSRGGRSSVEVYRVDFCIAFQLLNEVRALAATQDTMIYKLPAAASFLEGIFPSKQLVEASAEATSYNAIHDGALSIQIMCLGFLSYLQAHVGPLHPFFLDTAVRKVKLFGCQMFGEELSYRGVEMGLEHLTCFGEMLQGPVIVYKLTDVSSEARLVYHHTTPLKFDLFTSPEDLIDTWGPAQLIMLDRNDSLPSAIRIGGGYISISDTAGTEFHWSKNTSSVPPRQGNLAITTKILIGSLVSVNGDCLLDENLCRAGSEDRGMLRHVGTHTPAWTREEQQIGIQAGQYVVVQANAAYHKYPGRTLKQYRLEQGELELFSFLEDRWAVQVSLCTGVARRVPLRQMVAELLPVFANNLTNCDDVSNWENLRADHGIVNAFHGTKLQEWLRSLSASHHNFILRIVRHILHVLSESGLDREGKYFLVSWPFGGDVYQCLEINLGHQQSSWVQIIADSEDCATFAYASPHCLETADYPCRGADSCCWRSTVPLLETAVTICVDEELVTPPPAIGRLVHQGTYYFKTFGSVHVVKVEQPDPTTIAKLVRKQYKLPGKMMHRLYSRTQLAKRIRERGRTQETSGNVAWLTSDT